LLNIAVDQRALGKKDEALVAAQRAVEIQRAVAAENPNTVECQYVYSETLYMQGLLQLGRGDFTAALQSYQAVADIAQKLVAENGDNLKYRSMLGTTLDKQAVCLWLLKRPQEAIETSKHAVKVLKSAFDAATQVVQYRLNLSDGYFNRAKFLRDSGQPTEAAAITAERKNLWPKNGRELYRTAAEFALTAQLMRGDPLQFPLTEPDDRKKYVAQAVQSLNDAIANGWDDLEAIRNDSQFAAIRQDPAFQKLIAKPPKKVR
jgi:tetratricopeptide (TPR) repeat protein